MKLFCLRASFLFLLLLSFPFLSKCQVQMITDSLCSKIEYTFDDVNNEKRFQSPGIVKKGKGIDEAPVVFTKIITRLLTPEYFVSFKTEVLKPLLLQRGVMITLYDGQKINKPRAVVTTDVDYTGKIIRRSWIPLTDGDLFLLRRSPIKEYKLYTDIDSIANPEEYRAWLNCLTNKK